MSLRNIALVIPEGEEKCTMLEQDLQRIGMHGTHAAAMEYQERGLRLRVHDDPGEAGRAEQHFQLHHVGPIGRLDGQSLEGRLPIFTGRKWSGQPDKPIRGG